MPTTVTHTYLDAIRHLPAGGALSLPDVPWADYEALLTELGDGYAVRVMYDRGRLAVDCDKSLAILKSIQPCTRSTTS